MANRQFILALDIGSSSVRAALFDHAGNLLPRTLVRVERKLRSTLDGGSEIDADAAFRQVVKAIDETLAKTKSINGEITEIASCTFWHSLLGIDSAGRPTTPVLGWADNRSREHVATLRKKLNEHDTHNRTGARFHSSFWPAKLLWLQVGDMSSPPAGGGVAEALRGRGGGSSECAPFAETSHWISIGDYITFKLTGELSTSISIASGTGIFNIRENAWDEKLLRFLRLNRSQLPPVADDARPFRLNAKFVKRWPRLASAVWCLPTADGAASNIGSGCTTKGKAALMVGTSGAMRVAYVGEPPANIPNGLWCYRVDHRRSILGGALSDGGGLIDWLRQNLNLPKNAESLIAKRTSGSRGVAVLPYFAGERSIGYDENARGAILNLTMANDSVDILHAAMESVAAGFAQILRQIETVTPVDEIVASGGAIRNSSVFTQLIADALNREIKISATPEASMRGAVLLALETIGKIQIADSDFQ